ncbi:MAG: twin-arginine translocase subunit TatC [Myxococcales bacterium]|nr:twin-arginine translocase subunit TatC [Myxococcales bacterium]MCB9707516.1 twin-arginine translocase subunit TatC [Myxococcales bacterium]
MTDSHTKAPEDDVPMGLFEHLSELRSRLIRALLGVIPGFAVAWVLREELLDLLVQPLALHWKQLGFDENPSLHFANPVDPFMAYLKIAFVVGVLFAAPWIFWQLWCFVAPGLYRKEKTIALPFVMASTVCFVGGAFFGYLVVFPGMFDTLLGFAGPLPSGKIKIVPTIMIGEYLTFATRLLIAFGVVFEVPVVVTTLSALRLVTSRQLLRFSRWWVLIAAIVAAILTPPDVGSQLVMLAPMIILYFVSVGMAFLIERFRWRAKE